MQKLNYIFLALLISGCAASESQKKISQTLNVCARIPGNFSYEHRGEGVDYEYGRLVNERNQLDIYVGFQPNFPADALLKSPKKTIDGRFYRAGKHGQSWLLQGAGEVGHTFVMIKGKMDKGTEKILYSDESFYRCRKG